MKHLKKIMSVLLTLVMVLMMSVTVFADNDVTASVNNETKHEYKAYQIFAGTQGEGQILGDIRWGSNVDTVKMDEAFQNSVYFTTVSSIADVVNILKGKSENSPEAKEFARIAAKSLNNTENVTTIGANVNSVELPGAGYYLLVDQKKSSETDKDFVKGLSLLQVTGGEITIKSKVEKPSVEKKVQENVKTNNTTGGYGDKYNDTADYTIGDNVPFRLYGTVVDMSEFKHGYKYIFHDTCASSLDINADSVHVFYSTSKNGDNKTEIKNTQKEMLYNPKVDKNNHSLTVSFEDLTKVKINNNTISSGYIIVEYTAKLNSKAAIGQGTIGTTGEGNVNKVYLEYSNNPNWNGEGNPDTGETEEDKVIVFTYELDVTKVDGQTDENNQHKKLKGAQFKLYKVDANNKKQYVLVDSESKVAGWNTEGSTLESDVNGLFRVIGLDDGTYYLEETKAPAGYNKLPAPVEVHIIANTSNGNSGNGQISELKSIQYKVGTEETGHDGDVLSGSVNVTVENNVGSTLPETGGIGTTIFYVVGVVLMLGAGVLLITKRRMSAKH